MFNVDAFDEIITGTAMTWYTAAAFNPVIGAADEFVLFAFVTNVSGTSPALSVYVDQSGNNRTWILGGSPLISSALSNNLLLQGTQGTSASFIRLRMAMTGTTPQCRLRLTVTGRNY